MRILTNLAVLLCGGGVMWLVWAGVIALVRHRFARLTQQDRWYAAHHDGLIRIYVAAGSAATLALILALRWLLK